MAAPVTANHSQSFQFADNVTVARPPGTAPGDVLYAWLHSRSIRSITAEPSGWVRISGPDTSGFARVWLYRRVAGSSEPQTYTWGFDNLQHQVGIIVRVSGADTGEPENVGGATNGATSATGLSIAPITPTVEDTLLLAFYAARSDNDQAAQSWSVLGDYLEPLVSLSGELVTASGVASRSSPAVGEEVESPFVSYSALTPADYRGTLLAVAPGENGDVDPPDPSGLGVYVRAGGSWVPCPSPMAQAGEDWTPITLEPHGNGGDGPSDEIAPNDYETLEPGLTLRTAGEAAALVGTNMWEPRADNMAANNTVPANLGDFSHGWSGYDPGGRQSRMMWPCPARSHG